METVELKRCPFCNGEAVLEPYKVRKGYEANIRCNGGCLALMRTITYDTEEEAIENVVKAWNRRDEKITVHIDNKEILKILNKKMIEERGIHNERN